MKKSLLFAALLCLSAIAAIGQSKPADFSGTWTLDIPKSKIDERMRIEALTMTVAQTDKELKVSTETKRTPPPSDAAGAPGGGRGRGFGAADGTVAYSLDGKETTTQRETQMGSVPVKHTATLSQGRVRLSSSSTFTTQMGEVTVTTKENWSLSDDGKTLTVEREMTTPRGTSNSTLVFVKK